MKNKLIRSISAILTVILVLSSFCIGSLTALAATSGKCGTSLNWSYNTGNATLTVSGSGKMDNWNSVTKVPWKDYISKIKTVKISDGATSIGKFAFTDATALTSVTLPSSITSIGETAFWGCTKLASVTLPASLTTIGTGAFQECATLTSVTVPASVTSMGKNVFADCTKLSKADIKANISTLPELTFSGCSALKTVYLPASVKKIDKNAFVGVSAISNIYYGSSKEEWNNVDIVSSGNSTITKATMHFSAAPQNVTVNYKQTKKLTASGSGLTWKSSDTKIVSVAKDGTITGVKKGSAVVTATASNGSVTTFNVKVTYAWWQAIIVYVLFGWIWY